MSELQTAEYQAHAFHDSFSKGRASGHLEITESSIHFRTEQSGEKKQVSIPIEGAEIFLGGASDRLVFFQHAAQPRWKIYTSDRSVLNNPRLQSNPQVAKQLSKAKGTRLFNWSVFALVAALFIAIPIIIILFMDSLSAVIAKQLPAEWEAELGETVFAQYQINHQFLEQEKADVLLQPLLTPLLESVSTDRYQFHISIANDSQVNAFALPGGYAVINSGLILKADSAEEVLGVVAHELSHVTEQHGLRNIISTAGIYLTVDAVLGDVSGILATLSSAAPLLINQSYSRGFESDADEKGYELLTRSRVDPRGLASFFEKIIDEENKRLETIENDDTRELVETTLGFLSSHPATEERIQHLETLVGDHQGDYRSFDKAFNQLQSEVGLFVIENEETDTDERDTGKNL